MAEKTLFQQLDNLFSELIPLPKEVRSQLLDELEAKQPLRQAVVTQPISIPLPSEPKKVVIPRPKQNMEIVRKTVVAKKKPVNSQQLHQRLRTAESLRESIIISEILAPPVSMRKK